MVLDQLPADLRPIIQPIDTWFENRRLGLLFEASVGDGKLLVSSMDLETNLNQRAVARQMRYSLLRYMESTDFQPEVEIEIEDLKRMLRD